MSENFLFADGVWSLTVKISNVLKAAKVYITVYGTQGHSDKIPLTLSDTGVNPFTAGAESQFQVSSNTYSA